MAQFIQTTFLNKAIQTLIISTAPTPPTPPLKDAVMGLITNNPSQTGDHVAGDMTEPTFTGYARSSALSWWAPLREDDGSYTTWTPRTQFQATADPTSPETITGVALYDSATPANLLGFALFDTPIIISKADEGLEVAIPVNNGQNSTYAQVDVAA